MSNTGKRGSAVAPASSIKGAPRSQQTLGSLDNVAGDDCLVTTRGCSGRDKCRARGDRGGGDLRLLVGCAFLVVAAGAAALFPTLAFEIAIAAIAACGAIGAAALWHWIR